MPRVFCCVQRHHRRVATSICPCDFSSEFRFCWPEYSNCQAETTSTSTHERGSIHLMMRKASCPITNHPVTTPSMTYWSSVRNQANRDFANHNAIETFVKINLYASNRSYRTGRPSNELAACLIDSGKWTKHLALVLHPDA